MCVARVMTSDGNQRVECEFADADCCFPAEQRRQNQRFAKVLTLNDINLLMAKADKHVLS
jgi:hypothetical protein